MLIVYFIGYLETKHVQVAFDPVDGSSIYPANFAVGAIFGIWPGKTLLGRTGKELAAACYAVYGPRTILVLSRPEVGRILPEAKCEL